MARKGQETVPQGDAEEEEGAARAQQDSNNGEPGAKEDSREERMQNERETAEIAFGIANAGE